MADPASSAVSTARNNKPEENETITAPPLQIWLPPRRTRLSGPFCHRAKVREGEIEDEMEEIDKEMDEGDRIEVERERKHENDTDRDEDGGETRRREKPRGEMRRREGETERRDAA